MFGHCYWGNVFNENELLKNPIVKKTSQKSQNEFEGNYHDIIDEKIDVLSLNLPHQQLLHLKNPLSHPLAPRLPHHPPPRKNTSSTTPLSISPSNPP